MMESFDWRSHKEVPTHHHLLTGIIAPFLYFFKSTFINILTYGLSLIAINLLLIAGLGFIGYLLILKAKTTCQNAGLLIALGGVFFYGAVILPSFPLILIASNILFSVLNLCAFIYDSVKSFFRGYQEGYHQGFSAIYRTLRYDHLSFSSVIGYFLKFLISATSKHKQTTHPNEGNVSDDVSKQDKNLDNNLHNLTDLDSAFLSYKRIRFWQSSQHCPSGSNNKDEQKACCARS